MEEYFGSVIKIITIKILYLEHILLIQKLLRQKKFLKVFQIMQKQAPSHNKHLPIFISYIILKTLFSKIKIFIINDIDFNNKT